MTSNNKPSFSPKEHHYPQLCKILNMEDLPAKISKTVNQRNYILALNCNKLIRKSLRSGLEKKRRNLDRKLNRNYNFKVNFCQFEENKKKWENFLVCTIHFLNKPYRLFNSKKCSTGKIFFKEILSEQLHGMKSDSVSQCNIA